MNEWDHNVGMTWYMCIDDMSDVWILLSFWAFEVVTFYDYNGICANSSVLRHAWPLPQHTTLVVRYNQARYTRCRLPTRAGRRWQMVWQGPRLDFVSETVSETGRFVAMETPWVRFSCLLAFVPCFLLRFSFFLFFVSCFFFFLHPGMFIFFVSLRLCSSHLLLSASTYFIVRVFSACVICTLPHLGILLFFWSSSFYFFLNRSSYFSGSVFFIVLSYPVR